MGQKKQRKTKNAPIRRHFVPRPLAAFMALESYIVSATYTY